MAFVGSGDTGARARRDSADARLVLIAIVIAIPVAYYAMNKWLQNFAYHIQIEWTPFLVAGITAMVVALVTISVHTFRAANKDPAITLKYE